MRLKIKESCFSARFCGFWNGCTNSSIKADGKSFLRSMDYKKLQYLLSRKTLKTTWHKYLL